MADMMEMLKSIDARLKRIEDQLQPAGRTGRAGRFRDPKFPAILCASMEERGLNGSDLAALMFGRRINSAGTNDAIGKDRISVWRAGKAYPSAEHMALLAQFVDVV